MRCVSVVLLSVLLAVGGCSSSEKTIASAEITQSVRGKDGNRTSRKMTLADPTKIAGLMGFFPGIEKHRSSSVAGGWISNLQIRFTYSDGQGFTIDSDYESWYENGINGDHSVNAGLEQFINRIFDDGGRSDGGQK
jgi:hypothetical protein